MVTRRRIALLAAAALVVSASPASAAGPKLTVPKADLAAALHCPMDPTNATQTPLMFVTGTGATGDQGYLIGQPAFEAYGHPVCYMNFPDFTTADIQVSVNTSSTACAASSRWPAARSRCSGSARAACFRASRSPTGRTCAAR